MAVCVIIVSLYSFPNCFWPRPSEAVAVVHSPTSVYNADFLASCSVVYVVVTPASWGSLPSDGLSPVSPLRNCSSLHRNVRSHNLGKLRYIQLGAHWDLDWPPIFTSFHFTISVNTIIILRSSLMQQCRRRRRRGHILITHKPPSDYNH